MCCGQSFDPSVHAASGGARGCRGMPKGDARGQSSPQKGEFGEERAASSKVRQEQSSTSRISGAGGERHEPTRIALAKKKTHGNGELQQGVGADGFPIKISPQLLPGPQKKINKSQTLPG